MRPAENTKAEPLARLRQVQLQLGNPPGEARELLQGLTFAPEKSSPAIRQTQPTG
jgi:hypothetical protein